MGKEMEWGRRSGGKGEGEKEKEKFIVPRAMRLGESQATRRSGQIRSILG